MASKSSEQLLARFEKYHPSSGSDLDALLGMSRFGAVKIDRFGQILAVSDLIAQVLGYSAEELSGKPLRLLFPQVELKLNPDSLNDIEQRIEERNGELLAIGASGDEFVFETQFLCDRKKTPAGYMVLNDISQDMELARSKKYYSDLNQILLENLSELVIVVDSSGQVDFANPTALRILATANKDIYRAPIWDLLNIEFEDSAVSFRHLVENLATEVQQNCCLKIDSDGSQVTKFDLELQAVRIQQTQNERASVFILRELELSEDRTLKRSRLLTHDPVTRLYNRATFEAYLTGFISRSNSSAGRHLLAHIELCDFIRIREVWGAEITDKLLVKFAEIWRSLALKDGICARLESDKFVLYLPDCEEMTAEQLAQQIMQSCSHANFEVDGKEFSLAINLGVSQLQDELPSAIEVIDSVQQICADARLLGRNRYLIDTHRPSSLELKRHQLDWIGRINRALEEQRFELFGQRIVPAQDVGIEDHFEVLVRMTSETGQLISPAEFIPVAEQCGLVGDIDRYVVLQAFELLSKPENSKVNFAINLSGQTVADKQFRIWIEELLDTHTLDPKSLIFELTESATVTNLEAAQELMDALHSRGCRIALDDFGQGLSSFSYLKNLPVDFLKIDGEFIRGMEFSNISYSMVSAINRIGHLLDITTIGEGLETETAVELAKEIGIDYLQGYLFGKPCPMHELISTSQK